jgi:hypothetical protein
MSWKQLLLRTTALAVVTMFSISDTCYAQRGGGDGRGGGGGSSNRGGGGGGGGSNRGGGGGGGANFSARSSGGGQSSSRGGGGSSMSRSRSSGPSSSRGSSQFSGGSQFRSSDGNRSSSSQLRSADRRGMDGRGTSIDGRSGDSRSGTQQSFFRGPTSDRDSNRSIGTDGNRGVDTRVDRDGSSDRNRDLNNFLNGRDGDRDRSDGDRNRGDIDRNRGDFAGDRGDNDRNRGDNDRNRGDNDRDRGDNDRDRLGSDRDRNRDWDGDRNRDWDRDGGRDRDRNDWSRYSNRFRDDWGRRDRDNLPFRFGWWNSYGWNNWPIWSPWRYSRWQNRPYYWWGWTPANALTSWIVYGWDRPRYWAYGPGGNIWYEDNYVYYDGNRYLPVNDYYQRCYDLAHSVPEYDQATAENMDWRPLGVFGVVADDRDGSTGERTMQLAVNRDGVIAGTYFSEGNNQVRPLSGMVDKTSQRAAWIFADGEDDRTVFETSLFNLTKSDTSMMVHFGPNPDETEVWHLVRIERPEATAVSSNP